MNNIPLTGYTIVYLSIQLLKDILVSSKFEELCIQLLYTSVCEFLCGRKISTLLGKYQGA